MLYQIVSCITKYLEFRQFVQHALLVEPLLRGYLRGGGGGRGHGFFTASEQVLEHPPPERPDELAHLPLTNATPFIYLV